MNFFSLDLETTGLDERQDQILSLGIVADGDVYAAMEVRDLPCLHLFIKHERLSGHIKAFAMNAELIRGMAESRFVTHDLETAELLCLDFLARYGINTSSNPGERQRYVGAGKQFASFDRRFLRAYMPKLEAKFHHRSLDPAAWYTESHDDVPPDTETCLERAGLPYGVKHDALEDARNVCRLLRFLPPTNLRYYKNRSV